MQQISLVFIVVDKNQGEILVKIEPQLTKCKTRDFLQRLLVLHAWE